MIIYNVTVKVDLSIHDEWLEYMKSKHVQEVLDTKCFTSCRMSKMLAVPEDDGITYSLQYTSPSMKDFHRYQAQFAPDLQKDHLDHFSADKVLAYRTMMEEVKQWTIDS